MARASLKSPSLGWRAAGLLGVGVLLSLAVYLGAAALTYRLGFPLDDAWIHQTYARNLAHFGQWAFYPGQVSGGSTAPLWSALLAVGHLLGLGPYLGTFLLGGFFAWLLALTAETVARQASPDYRPRLPWVGLFFVFEWHLSWAAASGMETILHAALVTLVLGMVLAGSQRFVLLGLLVGVSIWVRPDGVTLLGPLGVVILATRPSWRSRIHAFAGLFVGGGAVFIFYLLFNFWVAGTPWPNTFYAKQAEYASLLNQPLLKRAADIFLLPLVGAGVILLPGLVWKIAQSIRTRNWAALAVLAWFVGYLGVYVLRLPVTYQHGRYIIPAMPVFFLLGLLGYVDWFQSSFKFPARWVIDTTLKVSLVAVLVIFWALGAGTYGQDVAVIESEMVDTAQWVAENIPPDALIAAHDIGALGYFANRPLIDLAGLVTPEVIPFIRDEARLAAYMQSRGVVYLVTFPDWYPFLSQQYLPIYVSQAKFSPALGGENMTIYILTP
ncbi:MAG: hypothetical protein WHV44_00380 [Anaerolineales bacterium]